MAYDTEGYGKVANPFWDLPEEGGGSGADVPDPTGQANYQVIGTRNDAYQLFEPNTLVRAVPNSTDEEDVGKVLTKYGTGTRQYNWVKAQAAYTDYSNTSSGLQATTVQAAIDEIAGSAGGGGNEFNTKSGVGNGMQMGISEMVEIIDRDGNFNLASDVEVSVIFGKIDSTDPIMPKIPSPVAEWGHTISKNLLKEIYDGWVAAGKPASYWNDFNQIKKASGTSMVTIFDMVDGDNNPISLYNHDIIMPCMLLFDYGINGMCVYINPNPHVLTTDANSGKPIFERESQASNNYGLQLFVRRTYIKPFI